jgi:hypothetical protein
MRNGSELDATTSSGADVVILPLYLATFSSLPQSVHSAYFHHSGSTHSPPSPLYHFSAVSTPISLSAFSFIHPFDSAPGFLTSVSIPHVGILPSSAGSARSPIPLYSVGHHAEKSSLVTSFTMESLTHPALCTLLAIRHLHHLTSTNPLRH